MDTEQDKQEGKCAIRIKTEATAKIETNKTNKTDKTCGSNLASDMLFGGSMVGMALYVIRVDLLDLICNKCHVASKALYILAVAILLSIWLMCYIIYYYLNPPKAVNGNSQETLNEGVAMSA